MTKAKKKPAKKAKPTLSQRVECLSADIENLWTGWKAMSEQLDKHQRTLELIEQREQFVRPGPDAPSGFSGPQ